MAVTCTAERRVLTLPAVRRTEHLVPVLHRTELVCRHKEHMCQRAVTCKLPPKNTALMTRTVVTRTKDQNTNSLNQLKHTNDRVRESNHKLTRSPKCE